MMVVRTRVPERFAVVDAAAHDVGAKRGVVGRRPTVEAAI